MVDLLLIISIIITAIPFIFVFKDDGESFKSMFAGSIITVIIMWIFACVYLLSK